MEKELIAAVEKLTEEVRRLREGQQNHYHYYYNHPPQFIVSPTPMRPWNEPYVTTCGQSYSFGSAVAGITAQPAT